MRVHASLRDDVRLWGSAAAAAAALFTVIVVFGLAPSRFLSLGLGGSHPNRAVVVHGDDASVRLAHGHRGARPASPAARPKRRAPATGSTRALTEPRTQPGKRRRTPSPVEHKQTPDPAPAPAPASAPAPAPDPAPASTPPVQLPTTPDPLPTVPTLPTVTVPRLPDPGGAVPTLPLP